MSHRISRLLSRLLRRLIALLLPATGRHRVCSCGGRRRPVVRRRTTTSGLGLLVRALDPPQLPCPDETFDVTGPLVRPYLLAHERATGVAA